LAVVIDVELVNGSLPLLLVLVPGAITRILSQQELLE
jgi:hypothetical protein